MITNKQTQKGTDYLSPVTIYNCCRISKLGISKLGSTHLIFPKVIIYDCKFIFLQKLRRVIRSFVYSALLSVFYCRINGDSDICIARDLYIKDLYP